jgi:hypothetical protein
MLAVSPDRGPTGLHVTDLSTTLVERPMLSFILRNCVREVIKPFGFRCTGARLSLEKPLDLVESLFVFCFGL